MTEKRPEVMAGVIERYRRFLAAPSDAGVVTLHEGATPLIPACRLGEAIHPRLDVWLKYEGLNPTGSFKDRGMTMAVTMAVQDGFKAVICASTGNTSASAAAYAARAGLKCAVVIPEGKIALGKLAQAMIQGAQVIQIRGNFDDALHVVREITEAYPVALVNSINPHRIEGQKTAAFEVVDALGDAPDFHALPVGNAGNITAYWRGYREYFEAKLSRQLPRMLGFQAEGAAPIVRGAPVEKPETFATAIRIGNPASWQGAVDARDQSGGLIDMVSEDELREAYKMLASLEGVFAEPASAAGVAGLRKLARQGFFDEAGSSNERVRVVCTLTGHGLKDPDSAISASAKPETIEPNISAAAKLMGLET